jgi:peptidoglycan/LPS O-acetylase OafA/YrhL
MSAATARIPALDGVRGLAIGLVLVWHYVRCQIISPADSGLGIFRSTLSLAWSGVDLFFVLSGFLIVGILLDVRDGNAFFKTFYVRRACRILPLYLVMVTLFAVNVTFSLYENPVLFRNPLPLLSYFTLTQNFFIHFLGFGPNFLLVTWSLAVEEQFYLVIPVLVRFLPRRTLGATFVVGILLAPIFRIWLGNLGAYVYPFARADSILMGGLIAIALRHVPFTEFVRQHAACLRWVLGALVVGLIPLAWKQSNIGDPFNHLWFAMLFGAFVLKVAVEQSGPIARPTWLDTPWLCWLGTRSYGIYLFHVPMAGLLHFHDGRINPTWGTPSEFLVTVLALVLVLLLAEASFRFFEMPFLKIGQKFRYHDDTPGSEGTAKTLT